MEVMNVEFKVAMDAEQAKLKNHKVVKLAVEFNDDTVDSMYKAALKSYVIDLQGQIRSNWSTFEKDGVPELITFGQSLYAKRVKVVTKPPTAEEMAKYTAARLATMTPEEITVFIQTGKFPE